jgi:hypothetical protein
VLVVDWTIEGTKDPALCRVTDSDTVDIVITRASGSVFGEYSQPCEAFGASIDLPRGDYDADVVVLDPSGADRTTDIRTSFRIYGHDEFDMPIDFPADSFF